MGNIDLLIGMNIITHGTFLTTIENQKTVFEFCIPSLGKMESLLVRANKRNKRSTTNSKKKHR